ncbi:uncharacterized protein [Epargyreus clarus]|uniref:uncharacterized protein n=1 Tax=Epargyreus clarus TaxID=520877 RepID=UPI003C2AE420
MPKPLKSDARVIILKVLDFMREEKRLLAPKIPFEKVTERVAAATGVSERFVYKLMNEKKKAEESNVKLSTPGKNRERKTGKLDIDDFDIGVIRRKIHEFYSFRKEIPTIPKLLNILREEIDFSAKRETLRKLLHKIGFRFKKTKTNRKVLCERNDITAWRAAYLQKIRENESGEKKPVVYLDETYIHSSHSTDKCWQGPDVEGDLEPVSKGNRWIIVHAGGEEGFVENALLVFKSNTKSGDYHDEMNNDNFKRWTIKKLLPNLHKHTLIVMDNAPYHSICVNKCPNSNHTKAVMQLWLRERNIEFSEQMTKPQLQELIKRNKPAPEYEIDNLLKSHGHSVLRLPPYHCDLSPIEMVWSSMKRNVAERNVGKSSAEMPQLIQNAFDKITKEEWKNHCHHVKRIEEKYRNNDGYLEEPFIIKLHSDSESDSSDSDDELCKSLGTGTSGASSLFRSGMSGVEPLEVRDHDHNYFYKI